MNMLYTRKTTKDIDAIGKRLEDAVKVQKFGALGAIDLQANTKDKGVEFKSPCRIYEVSNPHLAKQVLENDMSISTALACRLVVYQEGPTITIATLPPTQTSLFNVPVLALVAKEVEGSNIGMIDNTAVE